MPARKRVRDRPLLLTDATWGEIIDSRSAGMSLADCAAVAGIGKTTLIDWISDGRLATAGSPLAVFATDMEKARLTWKRSMLQVIARAADGSGKTTRVKYGPNGDVVETVETEHPMAWQAAAWLLERTWPEEFARVTRMEAFTTDPDEPPGPQGEVDVENVRSLIDRIARRQDATNGREDLSRSDGAGNGHLAPRVDSTDRRPPGAVCERRGGNR